MKLSKRGRRSRTFYNGEPRFAAYAQTLYGADRLIVRDSMTADAPLLPDLPPPPLRDNAALLSYSQEHFAYEVSMLFGAIGARRSTIESNHSGLMVFLQNARLEAFATHLRNTIAFLYPDHFKVYPRDVCAHHFLEGTNPLQTWVAKRGVLPESLRRAKARADREMAHLTTDRMVAGHPEKVWDVVSLGEEIRGFLLIFINVASPLRVHPSVSEAIPTGEL